MRFVELPVAAQTAYANVHTAASVKAFQRDVGSLNGTFASKHVKGRLYWYFQYTDIGGRTRQLYIGPDNDRVRAMVQRSEAASISNVAALAKAAIALGCESVVGKHFRVVSRLEEYGFFRAGGVLIGTHALAAMAGMLGVRWNDATGTSDIDFAHANTNIELALPTNLEINTQAAIDSLEMGFLPMIELGRTIGASYKKANEPDFQLDFVIPRGRKESAQRVTALGINAQPLRFMEFSLQETTQATLLSTIGAVTVNIPSPARFALHKLIVAGERSAQFATKSGKDLLQAAALIELLQRDHAADLHDAADDLQSRGKGWGDRLRRGIKSLQKLAPELQPEFVNR